MKKIGLILLLAFMPLSIFAYSDQVILGGQTLGIDIKSDGVLIVGFYKVNGKFNKGDKELYVGDYITKVENVEIDNIEKLSEIISNNTNLKEVEIEFRRNDKVYNTTLDMLKEDGVYKTGLYVKDSITGIGSLTYIDPETKIYGALGHEIIESESAQIIEIEEGIIFNNYITSIDKSEPGSPGSKNAKFDISEKYGSVLENTKYGIYGIYDSSYDNYELIDVASNDEIKIGKATIYTVVSGEEVETFEINITKINETSDIKNIFFEITDEKLINLTGGVVQGMSGSPIVQNEKLIGAVTHVIVDNPVTGYGLFITTMLEEGDN